MAYDKQKVIQIAKGETGYLEKKDGNLAFLYDKKANAGDKNYTKFGYEMHRLYPAVMDYPAAWCDCFVDWCFLQAYGVATARKLLGGEFDDYTVASADLYKKAGAWYSAPEIGDQIFFRNSSRIFHTGIVVDVIPTSKKVVTVEGNTSSGEEVISNGGAVCMKYYTLNNSRIAGYGRPAYGRQESFAFTPHWVRAGADWYYRVADGINAHGWQTINNHWYYFDEKGKMLTGLQKIGGAWYLLATRDMTEDFEGACCKTASGGSLYPWEIQAKTP